MKAILLVVLYLLLTLTSVSTFSPTRVQGIRPQVTSRGTELHMGGKTAKFGPFSPACIIGKAIVGEGKFNKIRGKVISLHSQIITEFCQSYGAYNLRLKLIKKAKKNGDILGFLS